MVAQIRDPEQLHSRRSHNEMYDQTGQKEVSALTDNPRNSKQTGFQRRGRMDFLRPVDQASVWPFSPAVAIGWKTGGDAAEVPSFEGSPSKRSHNWFVGFHIRVLEISGRDRAVEF